MHTNYTYVANNTVRGTQIYITVCAQSRNYIPAHILRRSVIVSAVHGTNNTAAHTNPYNFVPQK